MREQPEKSMRNPYKDLLRTTHTPSITPSSQKDAIYHKSCVNASAMFDIRLNKAYPIMGKANNSFISPCPCQTTTAAGRRNPPEGPVERHTVEAEPRVDRGEDD
jgi:hypothetical protein